MAENFIFTMQDLRKVKGGKEILKGIYLSFFPGAKIGVIGPNGAGKSTLLRIMAGEDKEFFGTARPDPSARIAFLSQEPELEPKLDVRGNVELGVKPIRELLDRFNQVSNAFSEPDADMDKLLAEQARLQDAIDAVNGWELDRTLEIAMDALRLPPGEMEVSKLSGGEKRRVALCRVLLEKPDLLLLDEPTNHLDAESVQWLEQALKEFPGTIVCVTHDRYFLDNVAGWILELDRGEGVPWKGNYTSWLDQKKKRLG
ncbi:MAG TPA: ATP-binding cassette domain-containing protein, partial [Myxococcaceae bacterium]|nr:ATP-binding cassette domain-containing protein [Myxococcaceae bacterium]